MDDVEYLITLIILTLTIFLFGGKKHTNQIEYSAENFKSIETIDRIKNIFYGYNKTTYIKSDALNVIIPNLEKTIFVYLKPYELFNVSHFCNKININTHIMIIYNYCDNNDNFNGLTLLISKNLHNKNEGIYYDINKKITITNIYPIINESNKICKFVVMIIKKPHFFL